MATAMLVPNGAKICQDRNGFVTVEGDYVSMMNFVAGVSDVQRGESKDNRCSYCRGTKRDSNGQCWGCGAP